jgi:hypothetical protein
MRRHNELALWIEVSTRIYSPLYYDNSYSSKRTTHETMRNPEVGLSFKTLIDPVL